MHEFARKDGERAYTCKNRLRLVAPVVLTPEEYRDLNAQKALAASGVEKEDRQRRERERRLAALGGPAAGSEALRRAKEAAQPLSPEDRRRLFHWLQDAMRW